MKFPWLVIIFLCCLALLFGSLGAAELDANRFMPVDEIKPGMTGVGKTVFSGVKIEEVQVEILGILRKARPHGDIILARVSGGPLDKTGLIQGMSGSPVYIDGRLIGAMAFGWPFAIEPITGIVPIEEMLDLWHRKDVEDGEEWGNLGGPPEIPGLESLGQEMAVSGDFIRSGSLSEGAYGSSLLPLETPVMLSGFDERVVAQMAPVLEQYNMVPIQAGSAADQDVDISLEPGASLAVQLVAGDASISAIGTLTYREGDRILGFGHPMFSAGTVDFPMTGAYVHSLLPSRAVSFKMASATKRMGVLRQDRRSGVAGIIGANSSMLPVHLNVRYGDAAETENFFFEIIENKFFSPNLVHWITLNALLASGAAMGDATITLEARIEIEGHPDLKLENVFAGATPQNVLSTQLGDLFGLLLRNEMEEASLKRASLDVSVEGVRRVARISSARLDRQTVRPGEEVQVTAFLEPYRGEEQLLRATIPVPSDVPEGRLVLQISDASASIAQEQKRAPHRFQFQNLAQLLEMLVTLERNDQLIMKLMMARGGVVIKGRELPSLPPSALAVLHGAQEEGEGGLTYEVVLVEKRVPCDYVLSGQLALPLEVKR